jgi:Tfp pilus assembly protein PilV
LFRRKCNATPGRGEADRVVTTILLVKIVDRLRRGSQKSPPKSLGIALVELVISALLFGWVLLAIFPLFLSSVKSNVSASSYGEVNNLARSRLEQLLDLPFEDPRLSAGSHATNDLAATLPDPETGALPSTVANPFRRTYQVRQFAIPAASAVGRGSLFVPVRVTNAGLQFDYKRIDVTVEPVSPRPELGRIAARVSALSANPSRGEFLSREDPDP